MRILKIKIKNIAALEGEHIIDFEAEPLKSTNLFAITGPTGSGKSTILDSICLALYGAVPKLKSTNDKGGTEELKNYNERVLLRRGTGEGFAEVTFIADDKNIYCAQWYCKRAYGKAEGNLQAAQRALTIYKEGKWKAYGEQKISNINQSIKEILGFTFDEFTRSVILAQGDFASFLKASENDKAAILEKITGTEIYSRISEIIHARFSEEDNKLKTITTQLESIHIPTEEEKEDKLKTRILHNTEYNTIVKSLKGKQEKLKNKQDFNRISGEITKENDRLKEALQQKENLEPLIKQIKDTDRSRKVREDYRKGISLDKEINKSVKTIEQLKTASEKLQTTYNSNEKATEESIKRFNETQERYKSFEEDIKSARALDQEIDKQQAIYKETEKQEKDIDQKVKKGESDIAQKSEQSQKIRKQIDDNQKKIDDIKSLASLEESKDLIFDQLKELEGKTKELATLDQEEKELKKNLKSKKEILIKIKKQIELLNNIVPIEVINLHKQLKCGDECPVCRQIVKEIPKLEIQTSQYNASNLEAEHNKAKQEEQKCQSDIQSLSDAEVKNSRKALDLKQELESLTNDITFAISPFYPMEAEKAINATKLRVKINNDIKKIKELDAQKLSLDNELNKQQEYIEIRKELLQKEQEELKTIRLKAEKDRVILEESIKRRKRLLGGAPTDKFEKEQQSLVEKARKEKEKQEKTLNETKLELGRNSSAIEQNSKILKDKQAESKLLKVKLDEELEHLKLTIEEIQLIEMFEKDGYDKAQKDVKENETLITNCRAVLKTKETEYNNILVKYPEIANSDEGTEALETEVKELELRQKELAEKVGAIENELRRWKEDEEKMKDTLKLYEKQKETTILYNSLDKLFGGTGNSSKFKKIAQTKTLSYLTIIANEYLRDLNNRYELKTMGEDLSLFVIDKRCLNEQRTVNTLSGGETFQCSLALALALSNISKGNYTTENLFIDEGFGTLDAKSLDEAISTLDNLSSRGSKIGIISHVGTLKERIGTRIDVVPQGAMNASRIEIKRPN